MNEAILIGTRGWNHASGGDFYPAELPDDWRFCYYSNNLRSVLVPQELWDSVQRADVAQWQEDSDPAFRFVLELPAGLGDSFEQSKPDRRLEAFLDKAEPIAPRIAGLLLRIKSDTKLLPEPFENLLGRLAGIAPVCVDLPEGPWRDPQVYAVLRRQDAGRVWHCAQEPAPPPGGRLMLALAPPAPPREVRHWIEQLASWPGSQAGIFFDENAAKTAQEARLIAELMAV